MGEFYIDVFYTNSNGWLYIFQKFFFNRIFNNNNLFGNDLFNNKKIIRKFFNNFKIAFSS